MKPKRQRQQLHWPYISGALLYDSEHTRGPGAGHVEEDGYFVMAIADAMVLIETRYFQDVI